MKRTQEEDEDREVFRIMYLNRVVADVILTNHRKQIEYVKYEKDGMQQPFSGNRLDLERFYRFLKSRCYEDERADLELILEQAGLPENNPYAFVALTHGVTYENFFWVCRPEERLTWDEVRIR